MRAALVLLALFAAAPAAADPCAKFEQPLAYNSCLARQGPAARAVNVGKAPAGAAAAAHGVAATRRGPAAIRRHGRSELVFSVRR